MQHHMINIHWPSFGVNHTFASYQLADVLDVPIGQMEWKFQPQELEWVWLWPKTGKCSHISDLSWQDCVRPGGMCFTLMINDLDIAIAANHGGQTFESWRERAELLLVC